ncbi:MAG: hypothetical protein C4542_07695 [Dehalococcoidia bacterium]|nr:MAG: hypothetical protein C4542_07695 [Dehalococcoidia bacterium]
MEQSVAKGATFKLIMVWLTIVFLGSFWLSVRDTSSPISMAVMPQVPRQGEPVVVTFKLNNPSSRALPVSYQFFINGSILQDQETILSPGASKTYQYAYRNPLDTGQQLNFLVKTQSELGNDRMEISTPPYPPQIWSSFISFASFSTSIMSSMISMTYYQTTFGADMGLNVGILVAIVLIAILIFFELMQPVVGGKTYAFLGKLRIKLSTANWILLFIFMGIVYTKVVMIIIVATQ